MGPAHSNPVCVVGHLLCSGENMHDVRMSEVSLPHYYLEPAGRLLIVSDSVREHGHIIFAAAQCVKSVCKTLCFPDLADMSGSFTDYQHVGLHASGDARASRQVWTRCMALSPTQSPSITSTHYKHIVKLFHTRGSV